MGLGDRWLSMWREFVERYRSPGLIGEMEARRFAVVALLVQLLVLVLPGYVLVSWLTSPQRPYVYGLLLGLWLFCLGSVFAVRRQGASPLVSTLLVVATWGVVAGLVLGEGLYTFHWGAFAPVIVGAGILLAWRATVLVTLSSCAVVLLAHWLASQGVYSEKGPADIAAPVVQLIASGTFITALTFAFSRALEQLQTKQRELEASQLNLRRAEKMEAFGQLAGGVAHDFNNILTGMLGHIDLIRLQLDEVDPAGRLAGDLNELERSADRGAAITKQLLAFSRQRDTEGGLADLAQVVLDAEVMLRRLVRENIRIHMEATDTGSVAVAGSAVEQVLMNLVLNASDAMPQGGALSIRTWVEWLDTSKSVASGILAPGSYAALSVADSGSGIEPQVLDRIFEPFFTTKPTGQGTGLGLATVHGIVSGAGGGIDVVSAPGRGTQFTVYLPTSTRTSAAVPRVRSLPAALDQPYTVLVCEDDDAILKVMAKALEEHGYTVHATSDPRQALERGLMLGDRLDLLVTDVIMPELSGGELYQQLKKRLETLPVLFVSGYTAGLLGELEIQEGDARLLTKPFTPVELLKRVERTLGFGKKPSHASRRRAARRSPTGAQ